MRGMSRPLMLAGFVGLALACQESDAPTTSTREARTADDGRVTTADGSFPSPVTLPSQPGGPGGSLPSQPGGPGGSLPSQPGGPGGSLPSQPGGPGGSLPSNPSPTNPPSFPSPGGGGSTPTPASTPGGGTPTPTSTPGGGGGICPASLTLTASDIAYNVRPLPTNGDGPTIDFNGFSDDCRILGMRVRFRVSATNLQTSTSTGRLAIALDFDPTAPTGDVRNFNLVDLGRTTDLPLLGTQMGTTCPSNLRFAETFPPFTTAAPPYVGAFRPYGETIVPGGSGNFNRFDNMNPNGRWRLAFYLLDAPVVVECWSLELDLAGSGGGGLLIEKD